jgi:anti-sigma B factor antagonist
MIMTLTGEVDFATVPALHASLADLCSAIKEELVIDLSRVTFLDSSGLAFLVTTQNQLNSKGALLAILFPTAQIRRLFDLRGLTMVFTVLSKESEFMGNRG